MVGKRQDYPNDDKLPMPGEYGLAGDGHWYGAPPVPLDEYDMPLVANLSAHQVIEHKDGTVTVSPSILVGEQGRRLWHGYLERGVWREV